MFAIVRAVDSVVVATTSEQIIAPDGMFTAPISDMSVFAQPGVKKLAADGSITVVPPAPPPAPPDYTALWNKIQASATSAVGVQIDLLTQAQWRSLFACLLYSAGAIDPVTLQVLPLGQWVIKPQRGLQ